MKYSDAISILKGEIRKLENSMTNKIPSYDSRRDQVTNDIIHALKMAVRDMQYNSDKY